MSQPPRTVSVFWGCTQPAEQELRDFYAKLVTEAAQSKNLNIAIIRHGIHSTTRDWRKVRVRSSLHITGAVLDSQDRTTGFALHCYVRRIEGQDGFEARPPTQNSPNPEFWDLTPKEVEYFLEKFEVGTASSTTN